MQRLESGNGTAMVALGGLFGLMAGFFFLHQMILISGSRFFERYFGLDRLARIHHTTGFIGYFFLIAHVLFIVNGNAALTNLPLINQFMSLVESYPYVLQASIALLLLDIVIITSIITVHKRLPYEMWYLVHLLVYAAVLMALFHQIENGQTLIQSDILRYYWLGLYATAFSLVLWRRWLLPLWLHKKHRFKVGHIAAEANGVTSIYVTGERLDEFNYEAGQFNLWQFLQKEVRGMHHPFTISSSPKDPYLRLSVKAVGDFTGKINRLNPGTPVLISGPYGLFTKRVQTKPKRLFIAGGIGITPIRSMLGDNVQKDDVLIYAAKTAGDLAFKDEFESMKKAGLSITYVLSEEHSPGTKHGYANKDVLHGVPDLLQREIWLCGPVPMMDAVTKQLKNLGVKHQSIHTERFKL